MYREFDGTIDNPDLMAQTRSLYDTYFKVFVRMTTCRESEESFLTPSAFGVILYDNFILDIPKIIDMCTLFGTSNSQVVAKMVENVFKHQPNYLDDVRTAMPALSKVWGRGVWVMPALSKVWERGVLVMVGNTFYITISYVLARIHSRSS